MRWSIECHRYFVATVIVLLADIGLHYLATCFDMCWQSSGRNYKKIVDITYKSEFLCFVVQLLCNWGIRRLRFVLVDLCMLFRLSCLQGRICVRGYFVHICSGSLHCRCLVYYNFCVFLFSYYLRFFYVMCYDATVCSRVRSKCHKTTNITSNILNTWQLNNQKTM
jgi:hypothetical protein